MDASNAFIPDVGYISHARLLLDMPRAVPVPPDLAVEVKSPTDKVQALRHKAARYLELGTRQVGIIYPDERLAEVYTVDGEIRLLTSDAVLGWRRSAARLSGVSEQVVGISGLSRP